jgi:hypothetical protein
MSRYTRSLRSKCIGAKVTAAAYEALLKAADERNTTMSDLNFTIVTAWLQSNGYLTLTTPDVG